jgi:hypothetical protein
MAVPAVIDRRPWPVRRIFPPLATVVLLAVTMVTSTWLGPHVAHTKAWELPYDLWGTLAAAHRLLHLDPGGLYTAGTGLVGFPGAAVILTPVVAVIDAANIAITTPGPHNAQPTAWLFAGPYDIALSATTLFAADAVAQHLGMTLPKRAVLATAEAVALWSVSARWGHPEDAVAVALLMYGILALADSKLERSAWLLGAGVAVQPLILLAVPVLLVVLEPRRLTGYLARAAAPGAVLLGLALAANWHATLSAVTNQPNWPTVDHPTPWTSLSPHLAHGAVAAGPARGIAILLACVCAAAVERRWRVVRRLVTWPPGALQDLLWWVGVCLALRCVFESVMVSYYVWPPLAIAVLAAGTRWWCLLPTAVAASALTFVSQAPGRGPWTWWAVMVGGLALTLGLARGVRRPRTVGRRSRRPEEAGPPEGAGQPERTVGVPGPRAASPAQGIQDTRLRSTT